MDDDELLDLVDSQDRVVGTILRGQFDSKTNKNFLRAAEAFIQNQHGQLWIPQRQMHKRIAPGGLDYSASGHVASGESYIQSAIREIGEELNFEIDPHCLKLLHKFPPTGDERLFFRSVFIYESDKEPFYNPEDFSGYEWLTPKELLSKLKNGEPAKRSLAETITYLIDHKS